MTDFCPCQAKQKAQVQIPLILDNKITLMLLIAADTPPAEPLLPPRYSQEDVEWLESALDKNSSLLTCEAWHMEELCTDDVPFILCIFVFPS